jgi:CRP-like cAMP-binding protein
MTAYSSFITGQNTVENIQAITDVELLIIPKSELDDLVKENANWIKFLKIVAEQQYIELEKRIFQLQKNSALQRYRDLITHQPEYIQHIPLQYLASYLGITQRHLSRIRKEISF